MWTKNANGDPWGWQHPSHKKSQVPGQREMTKDHRKYIASEVYNWFGDVLDFLRPDAWSFGVNRRGEYILHDHPEIPDNFQHIDGTWSLTLWALPRVERKPHRQEELTQRREAVHEAVTIILMNLIGSSEAGKWLKLFREAHKLPKLRKCDILGVQKLLW